MDTIETMDWTKALAIEAAGDGRFDAHVDDHWTSLQGVHGGVVAALAVTAAERVLRDEGVDPATTLRSATFGYVRGNVVGDLALEVEVVRRGRALVTSHVTASQAGRTTTVARLHHSTPWEGMVYSDIDPPAPRLHDAIRLRWGNTPAHLNNVETYLHPDTQVFAGTDRAEWIAWSRPLGSGTFDSAWLAMFGDYFPPAVFTKATTPQRAVTIEYSIQIHDAAGRWDLADGELLAARMHATHSHDGFAVEDGWIHRPDGALLATTRQTRLAG
jgi:acyl-CoA thioesterase